MRKASQTLAELKNQYQQGPCMCMCTYIHIYTYMHMHMYIYTHIIMNVTISKLGT